MRKLAAAVAGCMAAGAFAYTGAPGLLFDARLHTQQGQAQVSSPANLVTVNYQRLIGKGRGPTLLSVTIFPERNARGCSNIAYVTFPKSYMDRMRTRIIVPPPLKVHRDDTTVAYGFEISPTGHPAQIDFELEPLVWGVHRVNVTFTGGPGAEFVQFVLPI
jgi:hypothetical protein